MDFPTTVSTKYKEYKMLLLDWSASKADIFWIQKEEKGKIDQEETLGISI